MSKVETAVLHYYKELTLKDRIFICPICGNVLDRDCNAALNLSLETIFLYCVLNSSIFLILPLSVTDDITLSTTLPAIVILSNVS